MQAEIAAARREHHSPADGWRPDQLAVEHVAQMPDDRIAVVAGLADGRVGLGR
jgi:hypothetical protein